MWYSRVRVTLLVVALLVVVGAPTWAQKSIPDNDPDLIALLTARTTAEGFIAQGNHTAAASALTQSLRDCPANRPGLADAAYGNGQLASYLFLHVMQEADAYDFLLTQLDPDTYVTDKMLKLLVYIAIGLNDEQKTELSREITYLTSNENDIVRIITRFYLSNPYFYDNLEFTNQYAQMLGDEFPNLELTQISLNLALYDKSRKQGLDAVMADAQETKGTTPPYKPWSQRVRARLQASAQALASKKAPTRAAALAPLVEGIEKGTDWQERHFSLLLMKSEMDGEMAPAIREAARALAARKENTPDVLQARVLLANDLSLVEGANGAHEEALALARKVLHGGVGETTAERVMWETRAYGIQSCAEAMAKAGHLAAAVELYDELADQLPGSKIADACRNDLSGLFVTKPLENAAK